MSRETFSVESDIEEAGDLTGGESLAAAIEFTGSGFEYFKIWIVNVGLTILTLGIYSAWAKVRRKQYFYGNTRLAGSSFLYTGDPVRILKGRVIGFVVFMAFVLIGSAYPGAEVVLWIILAPIIPWVLIRSLQFNARNSVFRNIRFGFRAGYKETLVVFVLIPILLVLTLGLAFPWFVYRQRRYFADGHRYGRSFFQFDAKVGDFYKIYGKVLLILLVVFFGFSFSIGFIQGFLNISFPEISAIAENDSIFDSPLVWIAMALFYLLMVVFYLFVFSYIQAKTQNLFWKSLNLEGITFECKLQPVGLLLLYVTNTLAIILTLGFFIPWAHVRMTNYRLSRIAIESRELLDQFVAAESENPSATGEELGEFFDLDVSF